MRKLATLTAAAALAVGVGFGGAAWADDAADTVGASNINDASCGGGNCPGSANDMLGPPDGTWASLGHGGSVVLNFDDNLCFIVNASNDVTVTEIGVVEGYAVDVGLQGGALSGNPVNAAGTAAINLDATGLAFFNKIEITDDAIASGSGSTGADIDAVECTSTLDVADIDKVFADHANDPDDPDEVDQTTVGAGDVRQFKAFVITITNNTGTDGGLAGLTFIDVVPAEWDLDPAFGGGDGVLVTAGACTATGAEHTNNGNGPAKLQPDIITITGMTEDDEASCTIKVWVTTDSDHPGKGRANKNPNGRGNPDFTPTSCPVTLNDGVKVFDASMNLLLQDDSSLIFDNGAVQADGTGNDGFCNEPS